MPRKHRSELARLDTLPSEPSDRLTKPFARFLRIEAAAGIILLICALVALSIFNSSLAEYYAAFWNTPVGLKWAHAEFIRPVGQWITDGAMTLFFFLIALEIKREVLLGELRNLKHAAFSAAAAAGGMVVPALLFVLVEHNGTSPSAWGLVTATDTAFLVGCLALLGRRRIPRNLRLFLLSLAIFDDIGAVALIAFRYTADVHWPALGAASLAIVTIAIVQRLGIRHLAVYFVLGSGVWLALDASGVHPTFAGMLLGLMTPEHSWVSDRRLQSILRKIAAYPAGKQWSGDAQARDDLRRATIASREALSPLERLEIGLHPWVAFLVLPLFVLSHASIALTMPRNLQLCAAVSAGLLVGKPVGVLSFSYFATKVGIGTRPSGLSWSLIAGGALLTGIGFTMALMIAELAVPAEDIASAKLGVLCASLVSAMAGLALLSALTRPAAKLVKVD